MRRLLLALAALVPVAALPNGAPIVSDPVVGAPVLKQETKIRLVSESLELAITSEQTYSASATYRLRNSGPAATVAYGVPIAYELETARAVDGDADAALARTVASVRITIGGQTVPCRLVPPEKGADTLWCVASLPVPAGESTLLLSYQSSLAYSGGWTSKSPFNSISDSQLRYDLAPAGHWAGPVERVQVTLRANGLAEFLSIQSPQGWSRARDTFTLTLRDVELKGTPPIEATVRNSARAFHAEAVKMNPLGAVATARASSTLRPQGTHRYDAANVLDGDPATAWCEGARGAGEGQWIEVKVPSSEVRCPIYGYLLTPGYVRDAGSYTRNGRPTKVRLDACDALGKGKVIEVKLAERHDESAVVLDGPGYSLEQHRDEDGALIEGPPLCVRLTILEVQRGKDDDACVSEFRPVFNCG